MELKYAIYKRYSTDKQDSLTQDKEIADFLIYKKIDSSQVEFFVDEGMSGKSSERPQFKEMMQNVKSGKYAKVIAYKLDRLSRSNRDLQNLLYDLKDNSVELILVKDNIDTSTATGKMLFDIFAMFAEFERTVINERTKAGRKRAELEGKVCNRPKILLPKEQMLKWKEAGLSYPNITGMLKQKGISVSVNTVRKRFKEWD